VLAYKRMNRGFVRELYIRKMRGTDHNMDVYNFVIQYGRGIVLSVSYA